jgi:hypothetical protein
MFYANVALAFVPSLTAWVIGSGLVAGFIHRVESRRPELIDKAAWNAAETALVFSVFAGSVCLWIGLTYLLQHVVK